MSKLSFETILNRCANLLLSGRSVSYCLKMYPKIRGLKQALLIVEIAAKIPKKKPGLDKNKVWLTIQSKISEEKKELKNTAANHVSPAPFGGFRLAFSRSVFAVVTVVVIIGLINTTAVAAKNSLPGQTLYPVKRTVEKIELVLTVNDEKKTEKKIKHAENRLYEAQQIVEQNITAENETLTEEESKAVEETIAELVESTEEIANESENNKELLEQVVQLTDEQGEILAEIEPKVTGETKIVVEGAIESASESKVEAEENLAELEKQKSENDPDNTATTTDETIEDEEGEVKGETDENEENATTTEEILEILGNPDASSTTEILLPFSSNDTDTSSTLEIIDLR